MGSCCARSSIAPIRVFPGQEQGKEDAPMQTLKRADVPLEDESFSKANPLLVKTPNTSSEQPSYQIIKVDPKLFRVERNIGLAGRYEKLEVIGKGTFGEVRKVLEKETKKIRVMKSMLKKQCQKSEFVVDEIEILKQLVRLRHFYADR